MKFQEFLETLEERVITVQSKVESCIRTHNLQYEIKRNDVATLFLLKDDYVLYVRHDGTIELGQNKEIIDTVNTKTSSDINKIVYDLLAKEDLI